MLIKASVCMKNSVVNAKYTKIKIKTKNITDTYVFINKVEHNLELNTMMWHNNKLSKYTPIIIKHSCGKIIQFSHSNIDI